MVKDLEHLCFDKDGVLIDVHAYWRHTTEIRAKFIRKKLFLNANDELMLIDAMGINLNTGKIKNNGPIGYHPRSVILKKVEEVLYSLSSKIKPNKIGEYFLVIDKEQQSKGDFKIDILDGVKDFLLSNVNKYTMTVFTSDRKKNTEYILSQLGIKKFFKSILGGDSVENPKPHPQGINNTCKVVKIKPEKSAYISDTCSDLIMAENAKIPCKIGVLTGLGTKRDLEIVADLLFKDFYELSEYLNANG